MVQSHLAIPERAEPDTALNRTKFAAALDIRTIHPVEPEKGKFRIRMISRGIPPWSSQKVDLLSRILSELSDKLSLKGKDGVWNWEGVRGNGRGERVAAGGF